MSDDLLGLAGIRGKMFIQEVKMTAGQPQGGSVTFGVVSRGAENASWAAATPSGSMTLYINNPLAFDFCKQHIGEEVFVDIELANPALVDPTKHAFELFENPSHYNNGKCLHCGQDEIAHTAKK